MGKLYLSAVVLVLLMSAGAGLAAAVRSTLRDAYVRGQESGRAEIRAQMTRAIELERQTAAAASASVSKQMQQIEDEKIHAQEQFDKTVSAARQSGSDARACLDAKLVRALRRIGDDSTAAEPAP